MLEDEAAVRLVMSDHRVDLMIQIVKERKLDGFPVASGCR